MRHVTAAFVLLLLFALSLAQEQSSEPDTPFQAAEKVLASVEAEDEGALKTLAEKDDPDPWLVADELCRRDEHDAALAFAKAAPRKDTEKLPEYVASREPGSSAAARRVLELVNEAREAGDPRAALAALDAAGSVPPGVVSVRLQEGRGRALRETKGFGPSAAAFHQAAKEAEALGWLRFAARFFSESGTSAFYRGDFRGMVSGYEARLDVERRRESRLGVAQAMGNLGHAHAYVGAYAKALDHLQRSLAIMEELEYREGIKNVAGILGDVNRRIGRYDAALEFQRRALKLSEELGDRLGVAKVLGDLAGVHYGTGEIAKALECLERSLAIKEELGDRAGEAITLGNLGIVYKSLGDFPRALDCYERSLELKQQLGRRDAVADTVGNIGKVHRALGDYPRALECLERAWKVSREQGDPAGVAGALLSMGLVHNDLGDYPKSLDHLERALKLFEEMRHREGMAAAHGNLGVIHESLGDYAKALACHERSMNLYEELGSLAGVARSLGNLGNIHQSLGDYRKALGYHERCRKLEEKLGDRSGAARSLINIGVAHGGLGQYSESLVHFRRALSILKEMGDRASEAKILGNMGISHSALGEYAEAVALHERSLELIEELGCSPVMALHGLANCHFRSGEPLAAANAARGCVGALFRLASGVADEQGAMLREEHADVFEVGMLAGLALRDAETVSFFLESGRAGALLETLGGRDRLRAALVPEDLRREVNRARAAETVATKLLAAAYERGDRRGCRQRLEELAAAREEVREAVQRVQRSAKASADLLYPEADDLSEIRGRVRRGEALLLYGLTVRGALCLVVEKRGARLVTLARADQVLEAARAFAPEDPGAETEEAAATLRRLLVEPLGLSARVKRVLVSPQGALSYLPFSLLLGPREISYVPSGTTYGVLLEEGEKRGEGVLALGDPDYEGMRLPPLQATRAEATTVGDEVLLGRDASEGGLAEALSGRSRWRAVHFACHGLVDPERPTLSSLALTASEGNDGFLTCLDVFRMKIPADLVVLSACETAKGKVYRAEGVLGLTRAFMMAGAPRVLCSLWKVDDEATRALMVKFYELWDPEEGEGLPAAAALKQAQEFVRSHEKWKHPFYWAAWVLWGLPD